MKRAHSELFSPYRFVGVVTGDVAPSVRTTFVGKKSMISLLCPIDNVVIQYNGQKLRAVGMSDPLPQKITAIASSSSCVYAAAGTEIFVLPFCREVSKKVKVDTMTKLMYLIGDQLIVVDVNNGIRVLNIEDDFETYLYLEGSEDFEITSLLHPSTYLNKILLGSKSGKLRIVNFRTGKVVHEFQNGFGSAITALVQSTALDIVGIGLQNGQVLLMNLKMDKILGKFKHDAKITAISFRNDGEEESMVTSDENGTLAVWNLEKQELIGKVTKVHSADVNLLHFVPGEPIMLSASCDNSLRCWIFDGADGMPRELVQLEGHAKPITSVSFSSKHHVLSSGLDGSVRKYDVTSITMRQKLGTSALMSKAKAKKKNVDFETVRLENAIEMAVGWQREAAWDNVVCRHKDTLEVTTWTTRKNCAGSITIVHDRFKTDPNLIGTVATAICLSPCGNFVFVGYSSGHLDKFNVQSGRHIHSFTETKFKSNKKKQGKVEMLRQRAIAHESAITCISVDQKGGELASGCEGGVIRFWNLSTNLCFLRLRTPSLRLKMSKSCDTNNLFAVVCEDPEGKASVVIIDAICHRIVRTFNTVGDKVTSVGFSSDGKWLLVADNKCYIRVFELSTSNLIDVLLFAKPCVGLSFNPTGEFLATAHDGEQALYIWANKTLFLSYVKIQALPENFVPTWEDQENKADVCIDDDDDDTIFDEEIRKMRELQIDDSLITYSGLAPSRWANLPDLALIKERNKPTEAPRKIKQAPFFLAAAPTLEGFEFEQTIGEGEEDIDQKALNAKISLLELESSFTALLRKAKTEKQLLEAFETLKAMSVSAIDFQIRSMTPTVFSAFFRMFAEVLKTRRDFELVQSYMATAIKIHRTKLWSNEDGNDELQEVLGELMRLQLNAWGEYEDLLMEDTAVVQWIKNALL
ncbi:unnamed protein product [Caenorhabditis bovis]|uniref:Small-subunit processome Utp21 domain-containing protein n=1 Tax=Caenorhabditis bovis TaxID=2654633 RepID=A0A8S1FB63_9PELO|nr:unnamed protein product [Caenorhabditis bovis]